MFNSEALSTNIFMARKSARLNQKELGSITGLTPNYISMLENKNNIEPSLDTLEKIAKATNTTIDMLLFENLDALNPKSKPEDIQEINSQLYSMKIEDLKLVVPFIKSYYKVKKS